MKWDKGFYVTGAVYRMLNRGRINKECAITLLIERSKVNPKTAKPTVELWIAWPKKTWSHA